LTRADNPPQGYGSGSGGSSVSKYEQHAEFNDTTNIFPEYASIGGVAFIGTQTLSQSSTIDAKTIKKIAVRVTDNSVDINEQWAYRDDGVDVKVLTIVAGVANTTFESTDGDAVIAAGSLVNYRNLGLHSSGSIRIVGYTTAVEQS